MRGLLALALVAGCSDGTTACGDGTSNLDGVCTPNDPGAVCGNGTRLDATTHACTPDPDLCGADTVYVDGKCIDPTSGLTIDLEESAEPNDSSGAGTITLKPVGSGFVIHGCVVPTTGEADLDRYFLTINEPTLLDISADGVKGLAGGFYIRPQLQQVPVWVRYGVDLSNDMSHREVLLPYAGTYDVYIGDTRSLVSLVDGATNTSNGDVLPPAGNLDGTSCYYVTVTQKAIPTPSSLDIGATITGSLTGKIDWYTSTLPNGILSVRELTTSTEARVTPTVLINNTAFASTQGQQIFGGVNANDPVLVAADTVYDYGGAPVDYSLAYGMITTAQPLAGTHTGASNGGAANPTTSDLFYFDATNDPEMFALDIRFDKPVSGVLFDSRGRFVGDFGLQSTTSMTIAGYQGLLRTNRAGRYYLGLTNLVDSTPYQVTSTVTPSSVNAVTFGMPLTGQMMGSVDSSAFVTDLTSQHWIAMNSVSSSGPIALSLYDAASTFGRLDALTTQASTLPAPSPIATGVFNGPNPIPAGVIGPLPAQGLLVATATDITTTFSVSVASRGDTDLGAFTNSSTHTVSNQTYDGTLPTYYYFTVPNNTHVTATVVVSGLGVLAVDHLLPPETTAETASGLGTASITFLTTSPYVAIGVHGSNLPATFDITFTVAP